MLDIARVSSRVAGHSCAPDCLHPERVLFRLLLGSILPLGETAIFPASRAPGRLPIQGTSCSTGVSGDSAAVTWNAALGHPAHLGIWRLEGARRLKAPPSPRLVAFAMSPATPTPGRVALRGAWCAELCALPAGPVYSVGRCAGIATRCQDAPAPVGCIPSASRVARGDGGRFRLASWLCRLRFPRQGVYRCRARGALLVCTDTLCRFALHGAPEHPAPQRASSASSVFKRHEGV